MPIKKSIVYLAAAIILFSPVVAQTQEADLKPQIEEYLNTLTTFEAKFEQYSANSYPASGVFFLQRPRKFLWQYESPEQQKLVSNGGQLYFVGTDGDQVTQLPLNHGPAALFTRKTFSLSETEDYIATIHGLDDQYVRVDFSLKETTVDTEGVKLIMMFSLKPKIKLTEIITENELGEKVVVSFSEIKQGHTLEQEMFDYTPPHDEFLLD